MTLTIKQGTTRTVQASGIVDANGDPLTVTGWTVRAVIRQDTVTGAVVAEWHTSPTGSQLTATADGTTVSLTITPVTSTAWTWRRGIMQCEITSPSGDVERIIDETVILDPEAVI